MRIKLQCSLLATMLIFAWSVACADPLQITCNAPTVCSAGGVQQVVLTGPLGTVDFSLATANNVYTGESLYLAVIVPDAGAGVGKTITENGVKSDAGVLWSTAAGSSSTLWQTLSEPGGTGPDHNLGSTASFATPNFTVYDLLLTNNFSGAFSVSASSPANNTLFVGFTETSNGTVDLATPWSESLASGSPVPEPASLMLFGSGLLALVGFRKLKF